MAGKRREDVARVFQFFLLKNCHGALIKEVERIHLFGLVHRKGVVVAGIGPRRRWWGCSQGEGEREN